MNQKSAWYMEQRIRKVMDRKECPLLVGVVEADETYVGGKHRKGRDKKCERGRGTKKASVVGVIESGDSETHGETKWQEPSGIYSKPY